MGTLLSGALLGLVCLIFYAMGRAHERTRWRDMWWEYCTLIGETREALRSRDEVTR